MEPGLEAPFLLEELEEYASYCNPTLGIGNSLRYKKIQSAVRNLQVSLYYWYIVHAEIQFLKRPTWSWQYLNLCKGAIAGARKSMFSVKTRQLIV